jgi:hypothetical protein
MTHSKSHTRIVRMILVGIATLFSTVALAQQSPATDESTQDESTPGQTETATLPVSASTLVVESPVVAEVFVDNQPAGQTPLTLNIDPGKHTVRISADGFDPFVRRVTVIDGQTAQLTADLMEGGGTVEFQASVSPATLILDDGEMILPIRLNELSEGDHKWEIRATGYETAKGQFTLVNGKNVFIYETLDSSLGKVLIESNPLDATVFLDGENIGLTPISMENVDSGVHSVVIAKKGYAKAFRSMDNTLGNKGIVKASMSKMGAKVRIKTQSKDANVYIEDHLVGTGKNVRVGLVEKGNYNVRIVSDGYKTLQSNIHIAPSGKVKFSASLVANDDSGMPSLTKKGAQKSINWTLWGSVALGSTAAAAGTILFAQSQETEPAPSGDAVISLP